MCPAEYDQFDASDDSPKREEIRERSRNVNNVNPEPTGLAPVKSQAAAGDSRVQDLVDAEQAVVDPAAGASVAVTGEPGPNTRYEPPAETATDEPESSGASKRSTAKKGS